MYANTLKRDLVQRDSTWDKKRSLKQYGYLVLNLFEPSFIKRTFSNYFSDEKNEA